MMKRRDFLKTIAAGAVAAVVPLPAPAGFNPHSGAQAAFIFGVNPEKQLGTLGPRRNTYRLEITTACGLFTLLGVPEVVFEKVFEGNPVPFRLPPGPGEYEWDKLYET